MTVSTTKASDVFPGNGVATGFDCEWRIFDDTDVLVSLVDQETGADTPLVLNTDYTISGAGDQAGFTIATMSPVATGTSLYARRNLEYKQPTDFTNQGAFFPTMHEDAMDRLEMQIQQQADDIGRSLKSNAVTGNYDLAGKRITNAGTAVAGSDLTTLDQVSQLVTGAAGGIVPEDVALYSVLSGSGGASLVGYGTRKVKDALDDERISVRNKGAIGDGVADDSAAIQAAITDAQLSGKTVYIPAGTYKIGAALSITAICTIEGDGPLSILKCSGCNGINVTSNQVTIRDIALYTDGSTFYGLNLSGYYLTIDNIYLRGVDEATNWWVRGVNCSIVWYSRFTRLLIRGGVPGTSERGYGIYMQSTVNTSVLQCQIQSSLYCVFMDANAAAGATYACEGICISNSILIASTNGVRAESGLYLLVANNVIDIISLCPVYFSGNGCAVISGNWMAQNGTGNSSCVQIQLGDRCVIKGNIINAVGTGYGIYTNGSYHTVANNVLTGSSATGIQINSNYANVVGNSVATAGTYAIRVTGANCVVHGNSHAHGIISVESTTSRGQYDSYSKTSVIALTAAATNDVSVAIPTGVFFAKADVGIIQTADGSNIIGSYMYDDVSNSATNARFRIRRADGTNLPSGNIRFNVFLSRASPAPAT